MGNLVPVRSPRRRQWSIEVIPPGVAPPSVWTSLPSLLPQIGLGDATFKTAMGHSVLK